MSTEYDRYLIGVPATTANVGPGFDVAGIALTLSLKLTVSIPKQKPAEHSLPVIEYTGLDSENVPLSPYKNLLTRVALYVLRCNDISTFPSGVHILADNQIPFGRGLGSSGAAVIAGVLLGDLLGNLKLDKSRLLDFALMVERHPDNVTAALIGGFVGSYLKELSPEETNAAQIPLAEVLPEYPSDAGENWGQDPPKPPRGIGHYVRFGWAPEIKAVAVMPKFELATAKARGVLPETYSRKDLVSDISLTTLIITAEDVILVKPGLQSPAPGCFDDSTCAVSSRPRTHLRSHEGPNPSALPYGSCKSTRSKLSPLAHRLSCVSRFCFRFLVFQRSWLR